MLALMKIARLKSSEFESEDSWVDLAGYAACGAEIATKTRHLRVSVETGELDGKR